MSTIFLESIVPFMCLDFQKWLQIILIKNARGRIFSLGDTSISLLTEEKDKMSEKKLFFQS